MAPAERRRGVVRLLTSDEGYGAAVPFLRFPNLVGQRFAAEVPVNFTVRETENGPTGVRTPG